MKLQLNEIFHLLAAMKDIATARGNHPLSSLQYASLKAVYRQVFTHKDPLQFSALPAINPEQFAAMFSDKKKAEYALRFLVVTALMDGEINSAQIHAVFDYAKASHLNPHYLQQLRKTLENDIPWLINDITRKNLASFDMFPNLNTDKEIDNWLFPYRGDKHEPELVQRYENLSQLPKDSFGYHIWLQFKRNHYKFPGEEEGVNYAFVMPHDSIHVLSEYDTSPYGELLVSVFTSTMLEKNPIDGHVIPVMYSFYLGIKINDLAGSSKVTIDPNEFWEAWYRGTQMQINLFAEGWTIWEVAELPLVELRQRYCVLPRLENRHANHF